VAPRAPLRPAAACRVTGDRRPRRIRTVELASSPWWDGLRQRLAPISRRPPAPGGRRPRRHPGAAGAQRGYLLTFATWHGDWGPWNLRSTPDRLLVWDWERSSDGVPVGFDLLHLGYHTAVQGLGQPSEVAAATGRDRAAPLLAELGQHRGVEELLLDLYLLERLCRVAEAAVSAVTGRPDQAGADLLQVLGRRLQATR
jgi:hypothetical protein